MRLFHSVFRLVLPLTAVVAGLGGCGKGLDGGSTTASAEEPTLPPVLQVIRDDKDPELFTVRVTPWIERTARLTVRGGRPVKWLTPPPTGPLTLRKSGPERIFRLRVPRADTTTSRTQKNAGDAVRIGLTFLDAAGNVVLTVDEPLPMAKTGTKTTTTLPATTPGKSAGGRPVRSVVPADAPTPKNQVNAP
jgi:hypothetical protein